MSWVTVAVTVGSALVGGYQQHQVAKKQDNVLAAQIRQQGASREKVAQRTQALISQQQQQTDKPQETAAAQQYQTALKANQSTAQQPLASLGAVSDAYHKAGSDAALGVTNYGNNLGNLTAAIDAPGQQRQQNQRNLNNYAIDVNDINRGQRGNDFLSNLKLNSVQANPWLSMLTSAGSAYARAKLGGAGATQGSTSPGFDWTGGDSGTAYGGYS